MEKTDLKILIVDDSKVMRRIISSLVKKMGYSYLEEACCGKQALEAMECASFDLVISDFSMPGMSGLELLKIIRNDPVKSDVLFVMITAEAQLGQIVLAFKERADDYITKPFTKKILEYTIQKTVQQRMIGGK